MGLEPVSHHRAGACARFTHSQIQVVVIFVHSVALDSQTRAAGIFGRWDAKSLCLTILSVANFISKVGFFEGVVTHVVKINVSSPLARR